MASGSISTEQMVQKTIPDAKEIFYVDTANYVSTTRSTAIFGFYLLRNIKMKFKKLIQSVF